ncbi:MAG: hypothetical protein Q8L44_15360 [Sulfuritalea sp.]|nr:hypothetical protein [Sulfuritalea sp.]
MPIAKVQARTKKLVPTAAESKTPTAARRVRLSRAVAAKPAAKSLVAAPSKSNGQKQKKPKPVSRRYTITEAEYAQLGALKTRLMLSGASVRRSELLRAGLLLLGGLDDVQLNKTLAKVEVIKPRRAPKAAS